ncbi:endoplasmic reticulum resident protein 44-like [Saccoglossus kowalevskii]|uniref:Endoplasmic reticulum resident protein 44-like n=1 Tax=Saccoglossus kowalevskii TaxID=10224 RepID=A0ABM0GSL6_SACKO|nr:PREDICTED: endoplasmic reticulum resident protein 44-like [Saccoglossus kowalevskii]
MITLTMGSHWIAATIFLLTYSQTCSSGSYPNVVSLNKQNFDSIINHNSVVFVNFYADWCRFSQMLKPVFGDAAEVLRKEFPQPGEVLFAELDCDTNGEIAAKYHISKYPTLKLFRNGRVAKREYRGQRSRDAFQTYIRNQVKDPINRLSELSDITTKIDEKKRNVIAFFNSETSADYVTFKKVASSLRDDCVFYAGIGDAFRPEMTAGNNIMFRPPRTKDQDMLYLGSLTNFDLLLTWSYDKCVPLVREITFENGEELTEEGLPFVILFHKPDDVEIIQTFNQVVARELIHEKGSVNFLTADGSKFTHPLHHLGKTVKDLPLLSIDSFKHMYLFPDITQLGVSGKLKQFIADLHSGKLHREFHHGPDPTKSPVIQGGVGLPDKTTTKEVKKEEPSVPPESSFVKLKPSENRYTILRDEL